MGFQYLTVSMWQHTKCYSYGSTQLYMYRVDLKIYQKLGVYCTHIVVVVVVVVVDLATNTDRAHPNVTKVTRPTIPVYKQMAEA